MPCNWLISEINFLTVLFGYLRFMGINLKSE